MTVSSVATHHWVASAVRLLDHRCAEFDASVHFSNLISVRFPHGVPLPSGNAFTQPDIISVWLQRTVEQYNQLPRDNPSVFRTQVVALDLMQTMANPLSSRLTHEEQVKVIEQYLPAILYKDKQLLLLDEAPVKEWLARFYSEIINVDILRIRGDLYNEYAVGMIAQRLDADQMLCNQILIEYHQNVLTRDDIDLIIRAINDKIAVLTGGTPQGLVLTGKACELFQQFTLTAKNDYEDRQEVYWSTRKRLLEHMLQKVTKLKQSLKSS